MRLMTWNCQSGLTSGWQSIEGLNADVLSIQECGPATKNLVEAREGWSCEWQVGRYRKGLAVLARFPFTIVETEKSEPCVLSTLISGPGGFRFRFVGFWGMTPTALDDGYPEQAAQLIQWLPRDGIPSVIAGDFNASSRNAHHLQNVANLASRGLISAYHAYHRVEHTDPWDHPTSYHRWNRKLRFHMDYVFIPKEWPLEMVEVGAYDDYTAQGLSDHVPVIITVSPS